MHVTTLTQYELASKQCDSARKIEWRDRKKMWHKWKASCKVSETASFIISESHDVCDNSDRKLSETFSVLRKWSLNCHFHHFAQTAEACCCCMIWLNSRWKDECNGVWVWCDNLVERQTPRNFLLILERKCAVLPDECDEMIYIQKISTCNIRLKSLDTMSMQKSKANRSLASLWPFDKMHLQQRPFEWPAESSCICNNLSIVPWGTQFGDFSL